jgi:Fe-S cluster biogenesis protein NfuA
MNNIDERVQRVLDTKVRESLQRHGGDVELISAENGEVKVRFLGACRTCGAAQMTVEDVVEANILENLPEITKVSLITDVDESMWNMAKQLLKAK